MSRRAISLVIISYFVAALVFCVWQALQNPFWKLSVVTAGGAFGGAVALFVGSAIFPMVGWAFAKFEGRRAATAMVAWLAIGVGFAYLTHKGQSIDRASKIETQLSQGISGKDRDDFRRSLDLGCQQDQRANRLNVQLAVTDRQIIDYCDCVSGAVSMAITVDEIRYMLTSGKPPASLADKVTMLAPLCLPDILKERR